MSSIRTGGDATDARRSSSLGKSNYDRLDALLAAGGDRLNPILVKEARQALKSKQFVITFTLLLAFGWSWSLLGIALLSPGVYYAPGGSFMLVGYFFVLAAPVLIVVPFSAFRSLAAEREDGTFELLSITTLDSRQIVTGKLGSAVLQMLVYYSALAPCIAFTYMLRGVDIFTILFVLTATFLASILLSAAGLLMATISTARQWQVLLSVILLIGLLWALIGWLMTMIQMIVMANQIPYDDPNFWVAVIAVVSFAISFAILFVQAAAAQLSFASDNRSTRLRYVMLGQQVLWLGWMCYAWLEVADEAILFVTISFAAIYWYFFGALMSGELAQLSPRVKRSLPQSYLGRTMLTWLNPGSGTGYAFAITNLLAIVLCVAVMGLVADALAFRGAGRNFNWLLYAVLAVSYVTTYLGMGRLIVLLARRWLATGILFSLLINAFLATLGAVLPIFAQAWLLGYRNLDYGPLQLTNWAWTLVDAAEGDLWSFPSMPIVVVVAAVLVFAMNLMLAVGEVEQVRQETPERVLHENAEGGGSGWLESKSAPPAASLPRR